MTRQRKISVVSRRLIYQGRVIRLIQEHLNIQGQRLVRDTVEHPGAVVIVPLLPNDQILLVRQYRRAIGGMLLELPAGTRDKKESPMACARRELAEETGWRAGRIKRLGSFYSAPGFTSERMLLYLADRLIPGIAQPEPDELVSPVVMPFKKALTMAFNGKIQDGKTLIGLLLAREALEPSRRLV